ASEKLGIPFVFEVRDLWPEIIFALGALKNPLIKWYLNKMELSIYFAAKHIIALSPGIVDGINKRGYPRQNITMIPNFADTELFSPSNKKSCHKSTYYSKRKINFVFAGTHGYANGLDAVLDGILVLKNRKFAEAHFIFIGDGSQKMRLIERSKAESLDKYITWTGLLKKVMLASILPSMDVGLMILANVPGFYYGTSPNKFFDYIACGLPILCNYPGWISDIITFNKCGISCEPNNPIDFADKIEYLCDAEQARKALSVAARKLAENEFSKEILAQKLVATLELEGVRR
ncbi:glycosyltransferase family 4 protein, partial [candidate division KSB1 bacterium]|nr:glycosyltransferase family 4 protein [candidate division KSB1 bacterium]